MSKLYHIYFSYASSLVHGIEILSYFLFDKMAILTDLTYHSHSDKINRYKNQRINENLIK